MAESDTVEVGGALVQSKGGHNLDLPTWSDRSEKGGPPDETQFHGHRFFGRRQPAVRAPPPSASRFAWRVAQNLNAIPLHATALSIASGQRFYVGPACSSYSDRARGSAQATDPLARARQPSRFAWRVAQNLNATSLHATASSMASGQQFYATLSTQSYSNAPRSPRSQFRPQIRQKVKVP